MADSLLRPIRTIVTFWHRMAGRMYFRLKCPERARRHFEQVLILNGDDFVSYFYLARLAYSDGDTAGYESELARAKRTSPERMKKIRYLFDYFEPTAAKPPTSEESEGRTTWAIRMSSVRGLDSLPAPVNSPRERGMHSCPEGELHYYGDDFSSPEERSRFSKLPPITTEEISEVDWGTFYDSL